MLLFFRRRSFWANESLLIERGLFFSYWGGVLVGHRKTLCRTDFYTKIAGAAFEAINFPFFAFLVGFGDNNGVGWTPFAANSAKNTFLNINFYAPPGNPAKNSFSFWVHEGCRAFDQVLGHRFCHGE